jgi:APA family basic amino acid/polyamine antiporter
VLYIVMAAIATGVVPYKQLDVRAPIALVADRAGLGWMAVLIKIGAIAGLSSVILVLLYGQSRVFYSMSRDGLLPRWVNSVHPRFKTPWVTTWVVGAGVAFFAGILNVREAGELCSIGTLLAFVNVCVGVLFLRVRHPQEKGSFRTPLVWVVAPLGALSSIYLMAFLPWPTWKRLIVWFLIGLVIYAVYGFTHSRLSKGPLARKSPAA